MAQNKTAAFTGHRQQSLPWGFSENSPLYFEYEKIFKKEIRKAIKAGYTNFITGMALGTDMDAAQIVLEFRCIYSNITLEAAIPFPGQTELWSAVQKKKYERILAECDTKNNIGLTYSKQIFDQRNKYMVDNADLLIAVWNGSPSGTVNTVRYARKKGLPAIIINPIDLTVKYEY